MTIGKVTRGAGFLENFLAEKRAAMANSLIPAALRRGRILDIGCGFFPFFLSQTVFNEKTGIEQDFNGEVIGYAEKNNIQLVKCNIEDGSDLPFADDYFDCVTMLAVIEHIAPERVQKAMREVYRVLKPGGVYIITTPAARAGILLKILARTGMVSHVEIADHKISFTKEKVISALKGAGFEENKIASGHFEFFMNIWAKAEK